MSFFQRLFSSNTSQPSAPPEKPQLPSPSDSSPSTNSSPSSTTTIPQVNTQLSPPLRLHQSQQAQQSQQSQQAPSPSSPAPPSLLSSLSLSPLQKQISYLLTGVAFVSLSALVTRRSIARRRISLIPRFYHYSHDPPPAPQTNGAMEALEALNLATINVIAHTVFWTSGFMWALDIRGMDDLRAKCKKAVGLEGVDIKEAEEEFEVWLKETFAGKEEKGGREEREEERERDRDGERDRDRRRNERDGGKRRRDGER